MTQRLAGLIAATYTPLYPNGQLNLAAVKPMVDRLLAEKIAGLYVCGSTGEGVSLSGSERRETAGAFVEATDGRVPVIVQVGHNSIVEAAELASHAASIGADVISANAPSYFKINSVEPLVDCMAEIAAAAPSLPFYYYHIPSLTGAAVDMLAFLPAAAARIENLVGMKYTCPTVHEYQACLELDNRRFDVLWGCDEMLLSAWVVGAKGAIGSTYNIAAPLYHAILDAAETGNLDEARRLQSISVNMIRTISRFPFHPAMKQIMKTLGNDCGPCRLPQTPLTPEQVTALTDALRDTVTVGRSAR